MRRLPIRLLPFSMCALALCAISTGAQLPPVKPAPLQPPAGENACSVQSACADLAPGMIRSAGGPSPLEENLRHLTDEIGGRVSGSAAAGEAAGWGGGGISQPGGDEVGGGVSGSAAAERAAGWGVEAFRHAGVDEVHTEKFTMPVGWAEGKTHIEILSPVAFPVRAVSIGWSPATPEGGITADVVDVGSGGEAGFAKAGAAAKGAIVLVHQNLLVTWDDLFDEYVRAGGIIDRAVSAGAAAIFWMSTRPNLLLYRHNNSVNGELEKLPQAVLAREDAERIARFLAANVKVQVHLDMPNKITGPVESENVVAEIRGREKPNEFVLLGAHLDSWELGTGALDNGCNAAMVIDAARVIHASGTIPRRSIRFALFTGEEQGMLGSAAYARAHRAELDDMMAAIVFDDGSGRATGYVVSGRTDIVGALREDLKPAAALKAGEITT